MRQGAAVAVVIGIAACAGANGPSGSEGAALDGVASSMEVQVGPSTVKLVLHVTNTAEEPLVLRFRSSQRHEMIVRTAGGEEVWRWSEGMAFLQAISEDTLAAGESWTMEGEWDPGDRTGVYEAEGILTARDVEIRQQTGFELR
jgi:hypothetical protein